MNKLSTLTSVAAVAILTLTAANAQAAVNLAIDFTAGIFRNADGTSELNDGAIAVVTDGGVGFGSFGQSDTYGTDDSNNVVLDVLSIANSFGVDGAHQETIGSYSLEIGDLIRFVFFDTGSGASATPGVGTAFGIIPEDFEVTGLGNFSFNFRTNDAAVGTGPNDKETLYANDGNVVPEPATLALLGLGGLMIVRRRR
jgi:hypothetical protein